MLTLMPMPARAQGHDYSQDYLTFDVITSGTILWKQIGTEARTISYSTDNGTTWTEITATTAGTAINVTAGDHVLFKGTSQSYAVDRSNYSGFDGGTATYGISGNIMSLIYGDDFVGKKTMSGTFNFCSIFKQSKAVSAENLVLPATTLTNYCYRAMFSKAHDMAAAPALPATTLAQGCYWYMFEECPITTAPELNATTLVKECYGNMFTGCTSLNYIKCLATTKSATDCLKNWVYNVSPTGTFVKEENISWSTGASAIPSGWTVVEEGTPTIPTISCDGFEIELSCTTTGAVIYYRLDNSGSYTQYTGPITMTGETFIECYSENENGRRSDTISQTCAYDNRTIYEYSNQSLDSWIYGGNTITTPYSVNAIDGHSSSYAKGTFTFETDVNLRSQQPTYLWFQHADQSASIYVDNTFVEKHWGGYNAFFVDITDFVHKGTNNIKVALKNNEGNTLAPAAGDFNFNATLGKVKLFTSPYMPLMRYGYDGFHITSTVSSAEATINVKTTIPTGATVKCTISGTNCNYIETQNSTGNELVFTTTITNPHLWNGTIDPYLYNVKLEIYHGGELYHSYERPYGLRFYEYVINETVNGNTYTGFLLNGQPYLLRGVCVHDDLANKANALNDADYTQEFDIITELGCNFLRLAHYPHPKEVYDKCDQLGIVVQTEVPCVNKMQSNMPSDYYTHLERQYEDMVNQHYNHPCIFFWGLSNETTTDDKAFAKEKIEGYTSLIKSLDSNRWVGYVMSHSWDDPSGYYNDPNGIDWFGCNIYVGWYLDKNSNNPTNRLDTRLNKTLTRLGKPLAFSEYGCGGTPNCHSDDFLTTTTRGNNPRHDIEYQMWLHEGHIAAIKNKPELLFTSQWQLFDIAVSSRSEGYTVCWDGETITEDNNLKYFNNKGLVERDHKTKKDTYYLYKAWWSTTEFVHICGKNYFKTEDRVIKCYTNDGSTLTLSVNGVPVETVTVTDNIAQFTARNFSDGDVIMVSGATTNDTFTIHNYGDNVFTTEGDWNLASNWSGNVVPDDGSNVVIAANATIPASYAAHAEEISIIPGETLTIADGGQLYHNNEGVTATVQKSIEPYTIAETIGEEKANGWYLLASPMQEAVLPSATMLSNSYDLYRFNQSANLEWENYHQYPNFTLNNGQGFLYANSGDGEGHTVMIDMEGQLQPSDEAVEVPLVYDASARFAGFNLVGNPFACNAYLAEPRDFFVMNATNDDLEINTSANGVIAPMQGIFVQATDANDNAVTFTKTQPETQGKGGLLTLRVYKGAALRQTQGSRSVIDCARIRFGEGLALNKFSLKPNGTKLFITQGFQDYAVAYAETQDEVPINFKTDENGSYTLSVNPENTGMNYLHLIDNLTGADVDLLQTPEYTFEAKKSDYASRFRLVFSANGEDGSSTGSGTFAFISNGNIVVKGEGMLQVIDVTGRIVAAHSGRIQCVPTSGMTPGVYVLRLINGNEVKTQKIVIE
jgi:beta-galactosidase